MYYFDSYWSDYGCTKTEDSERYTVCECNHTTNFAILMQVTDLQVSYIYRPTGILHLQTYGYLTFTHLQVSYIYSDTVILHFILSILSWLHGDKSPHTKNIS